MKNYKLLFTLFATLFYGISFANNIQITNVTRPSVDVIKFDISWENSWYLNASPGNWDAAWVFIKAQDCNTELKTWGHADVSTTSGDHSVGGVLQVDAVADGKGVFIRRSSFGFGNITTTSVELKLQNATFPNDGTVNFEVMGIEMVAVLSGDFEVGGAGESSNSFTTTTISSEAAIAAGALQNGTNVNSNNPAIPADFPKGHDQFYVMKYEVSQEQYAKYLNLLSFNQQFFRTSNPPTSSANTNALSDQVNDIRFRNGVRIGTPGGASVGAVYGNDYNDNNTQNEAGDGQGIACNFLSWKDLLSYLDWAALRPMTELEYEKSCRGENVAVTDEFAWGNANMTAAKSGAINNDGLNNEVSTATVAVNSGLSASQGVDDPGNGPLRVGFAATQGAPTRLNAGASYWGVLDLTGNIWEQTFSAGYDNGNISSFEGGLGDGEIDDNGDADQSDWDLDPLYSLVKGGSWLTGAGLPTSEYCEITVGNTNANFNISRLRISNLDNSSTNTTNVYTDHSTTVAPVALTPGDSYSVTINIPYSGGNSRSSVRVWIDWNDDGDFTDAGEMVAYRSSTNGPSQFSTPSFIVPSSPGVHRMRVAYGGATYGSTSVSNNPCNPINSFWLTGEIEDYFVVVGGLGQVGARSDVDNTNFNADRHKETGGRGVRQF